HPPPSSTLFPYTTLFRSIVDLANGPPNTVGWAQTGAGDFQLFKFNATGVVVGDISVTQTFASQTLQANTGAFNGDGTGAFTFGRSEEHTSELQSRGHLVC